MNMTNRSRPPARKAVLPLTEAENLRSLRGEELYVRVDALYRAGWSLSSISDAFVPSKARTTVRSWVKRADSTVSNAILVPMPSVPSPVSTASIMLKRRPISPGVPPNIAPTLAQLSILARRYRSKTAPSSPYALANQQLTEIVKDLYDQGVPLREVAKAMGVSYRAVIRRAQVST
jgi:transposase